MVFGLPVVLGVLGIVTGSFLNVVILRVPREESIILPGSHCPQCQRALRPGELIPLVSFLLQRGRCRGCGRQIAWRYPAVELLTGFLFFLTAAVSLRVGIQPGQLFLNFVFVAVLIALSFIDWDTYLLPDVLTLPLLGLGLLGALFLPGTPGGWESLLSALGAGSVFWGVAKMYPQGMGRGDVKLVAALGAFLGFPSIFMAIFIGSFLGVVAGSIHCFKRQKGFPRQIPFGPYLALGAFVTLLWGPQILTWYWG